jgi:hypothetical protein
VRNPETGGINVAATIKAHREEGGGDFAEEPAPSKPAGETQGSFPLSETVFSHANPHTDLQIIRD